MEQANTPATRRPEDLDPAMLRDTRQPPEQDILDLAAELVKRDKARAQATAPTARTSGASQEDTLDGMLPEGSLRLPIPARTAERITQRNELIEQLKHQITNERRAIDDIAGTVKDAAGVEGNFVVVGIVENEKGKPVLQLVPAQSFQQFQQDIAAATQRAG